MLNPHFDRLGLSPFARLDRLMDGTAPGAEPIHMAIGQPQHTPPAFAADILYAERDLFGSYPALGGTPEFRAAAAGWLARRFGLGQGLIEEDRHILPLSGTREGLFMAALIVVPDEKSGVPAVLMPNPLYHAYAGAAAAARAEAVFLPTTRETGFLPDLDAVSQETWARTAAFYICSPANPQGAAASLAYYEKLVGLAQAHDFVVLADECYADIYDRTPPCSILQACAGGGLSRVLSFHSLSKRSNVPGLRSGFVAGSEDLITRFRSLRSYGGAVPPGPTLAAAAGLWNDDAHVKANRALYREKFDIAERILSNRFGFYRPDGGFFLWLEVGDGEAAARKLWAEAGIMVLPGSYLGQTQADGSNPGAGYIRVALIHDAGTIGEALSSLAAVL